MSYELTDTQIRAIYRSTPIGENVFDYERLAARKIIAADRTLNAKPPPIKDVNVAISSTRFSDGRKQTKESLAAAMRRSMVEACDKAIAENIREAMTVRCENCGKTIADHTSLLNCPVEPGIT